MDEIKLRDEVINNHLNEEADMSNGVTRMSGIFVLVIGMVMCNGCALLDTSTKTSDGDLKTQLGEYNGLKHAIGCKDFANQAGWRGNWAIGNNLSIMLESALLIRAGS